MELKHIALVKGRNGLFHVLKTTDRSMVLKPLEAKDGGIVAISTKSIMLLAEVSVYTTEETKTTPLQEILRNIWKKYNDALPVDHKGEDGALRGFMKSVLPEYDEDRVYVSDIRKLIRWYHLLLSHAPDTVKESNEVAVLPDPVPTEVPKEEAPEEKVGSDTQKKKKKVARKTS